ncbi:MAG: peptide chain release factor N(5)-glutamine methyltransferase [Bacteroidia bacterium]
MPQIKTLNQLIETFNKRLQIIYSNREAYNIAQQAIMYQFKIENKVDFILRKNDEITEDEAHKALELLVELEKGKPIQHLMGQVQFADLEIKVNEYVLIPRPETEELVYIIKDMYANDFSGTIIDIGTGSGCIPLAMKSFFKDSKVVGIDISNKALETAIENAQINNLEVDFLNFDILKSNNPTFESPSPWGRVRDGANSAQYDIIISNPPYIPIGEKDLMHKNVVDHEPSIALFTPNNDPLLFYRTILEWSKEHLNANGKVFFELHENYAEQTLELALNFYPNSELKKDMQGKSRFLVCG